MRYFSHSLWAILAVLFAATAMVACAGSPSSSTSSAAVVPITLTVELDRYQFITPKSMCPAILVGEVQVSAHGKAHWNTLDGTRPNNLTDPQSVVSQGLRIYTPITFGKMNVFIDHRAQHQTREFDTVGGKVGQDTLTFDGFPQLTDGGRYLIVFSPGFKGAGQGKTEDWLDVYNAFPIVGQNTVILQPAGDPKEPGAGQPQPEITLALADLKQQLSQC